jgi:hypothetical protein
MRHLRTAGPPADGSYDEITEDGCPLTPEPARLPDDDGSDTCGEYDTFGDQSADSSGPCAPAGRRGP